MVGSGSPLLADSSLSPTSPPASAIRSSRSKARSSDCTPPALPLGALAALGVLAELLELIDGTSGPLEAAGPPGSGPSAVPQPTGRRWPEHRRWPCVSMVQGGSSAGSTGPPHLR